MYMIKHSLHSLFQVASATWSTLVLACALFGVWLVWSSNHNF